ncbi:MAG: ATP-binding protein, partial [Planctomycetota bacterium]
YDAKDLTTHAVCVGMTGSGKTGLCLSLLEEAAIDDIPALIVDPKGDLGNLLLTFPELDPDDFEPWIDPGEASRKGRTVRQHAEKTAALWTRGLGSWGQDGERIARLRERVDMSIYTPGSNAGLPLAVLKSFAAPSDAVLSEEDLLRDRVIGTVSGLLALLNIDADPVQSREHILISTILDRAWRKSEDLELATLIGAIQEPDFDRLGVMSLDAFFPPKDRVKLALKLNGLLAAPGFQSWLEGDPLDIERLLWTESGKPRLTILSIAHLSEAERMFFVTLVLNELLAWVRTQAGTSSLRALFYMDEVFGYLPPVANPPSKRPMLTLLKQARAFGVGLVLATQNPVDLDYKALSNAGTWFLGRLQTERDVARVLDGLQGASEAAGQAFDRQEIESILGGLKSRVFLMNNVHDDEPVLFHTRWAMSYLRGPLTRTHIQTLMTDKKKTLEHKPSKKRGRSAKRATQPSAEAESDAQRVRQDLPDDVPEYFFKNPGAAPETPWVPHLLGRTKLHFNNTKHEIDAWDQVVLLAPLGTELSNNPWEDADRVQLSAKQFGRRAPKGARFASIAKKALKKTSYKSWTSKLKTFVYRTFPRVAFRSREAKAYSQGAENERSFRSRLVQELHEQRDLAVNKLRRKYETKLDKLRERIRKTEAKADAAEDVASRERMESFVDVGASLIGALFGRRRSAAGSAARKVARGSTRGTRSRARVQKYSADARAMKADLAELEQELEEEIRELTLRQPSGLEIEPVLVRAKKGDIVIDEVAVVWIPEGEVTS